MKLPVPVFDSSQIQIPNPPPIKFSSFEGQPLTAWRPSQQRRDNSPHRSTPIERPSSKLTNGPRSPREKNADIALEGRSSPQSQHKRGLASPKKWAEPSLDKRSKTILDVLQSKRASKQGESANIDSPDGTNRSSNHLSSVNGEITQDKVIKYPKFVVREKKKSSNSDHKKQTNMDSENKTFARSQSMRQQKKQEYYKSSGVDNFSGKSEIYREADVRRSYRPQRTGRPMQELSGIPVYTPKQKPPSTNRDNREKSGAETITDQSVEDFIMGFFPDEMQDHLQTKPTNVFQGRPDSTQFEHVPPPPTPASQLLMQLGVDPNDPQRIEEELRYEMRLQMERRRSMRDKTRNRDTTQGNKRDRSDPGVSNTTHKLLESNIIRHNFVFPNLTADSHRKSLTTPRHEENFYRMSPAPFGRPKPNFNMGNIQFVAAAVQSYDMNDTLQEPTREKSASKIDLSQSHDQLATQENQRSQSSMGITTGIARSHSFYQGQKKPDKYSRMISLGLPKVNIDIDKNHFSQGNIMRRSLDRREKYQVPENIKDFKVGEQDNSKYIKKYAVPADDEHVNGDRKSTKSRKNTGRANSGQRNGNADNLDSSFLLHDSGDSDKGPECSSHIKFVPPPNTPIDVDGNVFHRRSTVRKKSSKIPVKSRTIDHSRGAVGVSYFKMVNPGEKTEENGTKQTDKPCDAQKYAYGLSTNEIAL